MYLGETNTEFGQRGLASRLHTLRHHVKVYLFRYKHFLYHPVDEYNVKIFAKYCDERFCMSVCPFVYLKNDTCELH